MSKPSGFGLFSLVIGLAIIAALVYYSLNLYERPARPPVGSEEERLLEELPLSGNSNLPGFFGAVDAAKNAKSQVESRY